MLLSRTLELNVLKDFALSSSIETILPSSSLPDQPLQFMVIVQDSLGGIRNFTTPLSILPLSSESLDVPTTRAELEAIQDDVEKEVPMLNILASAIYPIVDNEQITELKLYLDRRL